MIINELKASIKEFLMKSSIKIIYKLKLLFNLKCLNRINLAIKAQIKKIKVNFKLTITMFNLKFFFTDLELTQSQFVSSKTYLQTKKK